MAKLPTISKSAAPGQYLGFTLQQVRFCHHLLRVPDGVRASLEHLDDVALHIADGSVLLEQCKSALSGNPASDRSEDVWKTFANWADLCTAGKVPLSTTSFQLYVTPENTGELVERMSASVTTSSVAGVLEAIKGLIDPEKPHVGCSPFITSFLGAGDTICSQIIRSFKFVTEADPIESVRQQLRALIASDTLNDLCAVAMGMATDRVGKLLREGSVPILDAAEYRKQFHAFVRKHNLSNFLISSPQPGEEVVSALVATSPVFVEQLRAVEASQDMLVVAVSDYLRTTADKIEWAAEGYILRDSFDELDTQLIRKHALVRDEVEDTMPYLTEPQRGRALYRKCAETNLPLEGQVLPSYFVPGAFNSLADYRKLGWHPKHKEMFPIE